MKKELDWYWLCDCVAVMGVCAMDVINGDVDYSQEDLDKNPAVSNNEYYRACSEYAYMYNKGANHVHEGGNEIKKHWVVGYPCDEWGTAISQEEWDTKYEYKDGMVIRK